MSRSFPHDASVLREQLRRSAERRHYRRSIERGGSGVLSVLISGRLVSRRTDRRDVDALVVVACAAAIGALAARAPAIAVGAVALALVACTPAWLLVVGAIATARGF